MYRKTRAAGFGDEVKRRIMLGTYALSAGYYDAYYLKAQKVRTLIRRDFDDGLRAVDADRRADDARRRLQARREDDDPLSMYLNDMFTIPANLAGLPGDPCPAASRRGPARRAAAHRQGLRRGDACCARRTPTSSATDWHTRRPSLEP